MLTRRQAFAGLVVAGLGALAMPAIVRAQARGLRLRRGMNLWPWFSLTREFPSAPHRLRLAAVSGRSRRSDARRSGGVALRRHRLRAPAGRSRAAAGVLGRAARAAVRRCSGRDRALPRRGADRHRQSAPERRDASLQSAQPGRRRHGAAVHALSRSGARSRGAAWRSSIRRASRSSRSTSRRKAAARPTGP